MPLIKFDMIKGRTPEEITKILDVSHKVFVEALNIPEGDRYQIVTQHEPYEMILKDTGLGFERTTNAILLTVISRPRTVLQKTQLYASLQKAFQQELGMIPEDLMINFVINDDEDWSFAYGRAQFLTNELS
ncbi:hypothetical protein RV11_GL002791 [Enterococcus phoeniculicola]|uniref:Tautomerase n=1 Tax=Enterococcus phoeniculicola ATCC BAA-412 TaxID=1158610 RepID=R3W1Z0_9ENTE|nr:tautomerase family protein [Enterococcus phoeniculicola]EOL41687.1 hypothetical protein UC3_03252 [Enterococcus phoeniculicola ATCC BAA-412]EOT78819.1 hypothetical protein I589_00324 [Enterococcus phoeniculicola ATCC BAA-412]OJG72652.1 hypothetical protein RV11_GL002791 [Enterococcus phoeniculicola]